MNMKGLSSSKKKDDSNNSCELEAEHRNRANLIQRLVSNLTEGRKSSAASLPSRFPTAATANKSKLSDRNGVEHSGNINDNLTSSNSNRNHTIGNQSISNRNETEQNRYDGIASKFTVRTNNLKQLNHIDSRNSNNKMNIIQNEYNNDYDNEGPEPLLPPPPAYRNNDNDDYRNNVKNKYHHAKDDNNMNRSYNYRDDSTNDKQRYNGSNVILSTALSSRSNDDNTNDQHNKYVIKQRFNSNNDDNATALSSRSNGDTGTRSEYSGDLDTHTNNRRNNADNSSKNSSNDTQKSARLFDGRLHSVNSGNHADRSHSINTTNINTQGISIAEQRTILEKKHNERRERVAALHKQAEERVHLRQKDKERLLSEKDVLEFVTLENLREEKRIEIAQRKLKIPTVILTKEQQDHVKEIIKKAELFRRAQLLYVVFSPWIQLMEQVRLNNIKAYEHSCYQTLKCSWKYLIRYTVIQRTDRIRSEFRKSSQATSHYRHKLYKVMWKRWSLYTKILRAKAKAVDGQAGKFSLKRITFAGWRLVLERCHRQSARQMRFVGPKGDRIVLKYCWKQWCLYLKNNEIEREVRNRTAASWNKVQEWMRQDK